MLLTESAPAWWLLASFLGVMSVMFELAHTLALPRPLAVAAVAVLVTGTGAAFLAGPRMDVVMLGVCAMVVASIRLGFMVGSHRATGAER